MLTQEEAKVRADRVRKELEVICHPNSFKDQVVTCEDCLDNDCCDFAFDHYNTDGDCLAIK